MPLVNAKCTNCGGVLQVDDSKEAAICPFCESAYIVEKAINNYNITNNLNVSNSVVNVYIEQSFDTKGFLKRAKQALKFYQFKEAAEIFKSVLDKEPQNQCASTGIMLCIAMEACLTWENEIFLRVPNDKHDHLLKGNSNEMMEVHRALYNSLLKAQSYNQENYYLVLDFLARRGCEYEKKYQKTHKYPYYACIYRYYSLFSEKFNDYEYSKLIMDRIKYYDNYEKYASEPLERWEDPDSRLSWEEYASDKELLNENLIGEGKYLFKAINFEKYEEAMKEYNFICNYGLKER